MRPRINLALALSQNRFFSSLLTMMPGASFDDAGSEH
jgi:hypothetical protein